MYFTIFSMSWFLKLAVSGLNFHHRGCVLMVMIFIIDNIKEIT